MLGAKPQDQQALDWAAQGLFVPGLTFAEHGPRDLGPSYGYREGRADLPLRPEVVAVGDMVLELTKERGMLFLDNVLPENVAAQIDRGVMIGALHGRSAPDPCVKMFDDRWEVTVECGDVRPHDEVWTTSPLFLGSLSGQRVALVGELRGDNLANPVRCRLEVDLTLNQDR